MIEPPKTIVLAGQDYSIEYVQSKDQPGCNADIYITTSKIKIREDCSLDYKKYLLCHEMVHGLSDSFSSMKEDLTEGQVCRLSRSLFIALADINNQKVWRWLLEKEVE